jgi:hypothetical protein
VYHNQYGKTIGIIWHPGAFQLHANPNLTTARGPKNTNNNNNNNNSNTALGVLLEPSELLHRMPILNVWLEW